MANFTTVDDLVADALWVAGEAQTSVSSYYVRALDYLNAVYTALLSGGSFADHALPSIDWWWAQVTRPGSIALLNLVENSAITLTATNASATINFSSGPGTALVNYRIAFLQDLDQLLYVTTHASGAATSATIDLAWQKATYASTSWVAWKDHYALPNDFLRFTTPLTMSRVPYEVQLVDPVVMRRTYPIARLWRGTPQVAAIEHVDTGAGYSTPTLHFSHMISDGPIVLNFEYLAKLTALALGTEPRIPFHHRRILSLGAAYLMLLDKVDGKAGAVFQQFQSAWDAMAEEHYRHTSDNKNFGRIITRPGFDPQNAFPLRSPSGHIYG